MSPEITWFPEQVFGDLAGTRKTVPLQTQQKSVAYLRSMLSDGCKPQILLGSAGSGKSTIIRLFRAALRSDLAVAVVDGSGMKPENFLHEVLGQFGYHMDTESTDDLLRMLRVFAIQQTRAGRTPILVVENIESMRPDTLRTLCVIAEFRLQNKFVVGIVMTGTARARRLIESRGMTAIRQRTESYCEIEPFTMRESMHFLHGKLTSSRIPRPDSILPVAVCEEIHRLSRGHPGRLNEIARGTLERAVSFPATESDVIKQQEAMTKGGAMPELIVTLNGETIERLIIREKKLTIGRSSLADLVIHNEYASKFHALLLLYDQALVLVDLNSSNGTTVNSVTVSSTFLQTDDIISIANYRMKVVNAPASDARRINVTTEDTSKMKTLDKMREERKIRFPFHDIIRRVKDKPSGS